MPLSYLLDEHLRGPLWSAFQRHNSRGQNIVDAVRVGDAADLPLGTPDPEILLWAEREARILLSFDMNTMPGYFANHLSAGHHSPGVFILRGHATLAEVVDFLVIVAHASDAYEWQDRIEYIG